MTTEEREREIADERRYYIVRDADRNSYKGSGKINRWGRERVMDVTDNLTSAQGTQRRRSRGKFSTGMNNDKDDVHRRVVFTQHFK